MNSQIKSRERVKKFAEVYTAEREVKAMCDLIPNEIYKNLESTFLEPAVGYGVFLIEILKRKFVYCQSEKDGLKALNSVYGVDIQKDNVAECRLRLIELYKKYFPQANNFAILTALAITNNNIVCDDSLNPKTEKVKKWFNIKEMKQLSFLHQK